MLMDTHNHIAGLAEWKILELRNLYHLHQKLEIYLYIVNITPTHSFSHKSILTLQSYEEKKDKVHWTFPSIVSYF